MSMPKNSTATSEKNVSNRESPSAVWTSIDPKKPTPSLFVNKRLRHSSQVNLS